MVENIADKLSLKIAPHILRSKDPRVILTTLFGAWLPLSTAVLVSATEHLPAPPAAQASRLPALISSSPGSDYVAPAVREAMIQLKSSNDDPVVAYISKMVSIPSSELPQSKRKAGGTLSAEEARDMARKKRAEIAKAQAAIDGTTDDATHSLPHALNSASIGENVNGDHVEEVEREDPEYLIGFARLYSGTLSVGDKVYVLPPKFSPANPHTKPEPQRVTVTGLYLLMGRGLEALTSVPAGVVFGIAGLEGHILKSGTLCSQLEGSINLAGVNIGSQPIVRVALEPVNPGDLGKMIVGMRLLEQSDPCAQYEVLENGEHVILTAGELHLERCLKDLRERFARCEIQASAPIVPYRESIIDAAEMAPPKDKSLPRGTVIGVTSSKQITVRLRVMPLPSSVTELLEKHSASIRRLHVERTEDEAGIQLGGSTEEDLDHDDRTTSVALNEDYLSTSEFEKELQKIFAESIEQSRSWTGVTEKIAAFGPRRIGPNILVDSTKEGIFRKL